MKKILILFSFLLVATMSFAQFTDTAQLKTFIRDTIKDRRPDKVTAAQLQKALLGISNFLQVDTAKKITLASDAFQVGPLGDGTDPIRPALTIQAKKGASYKIRYVLYFNTSYQYGWSNGTYHVVSPGADYTATLNDSTNGQGHIITASNTGDTSINFVDPYAFYYGDHIVTIDVVLTNVATAGEIKVWLEVGCCPNNGSAFIGAGSYVEYIETGGEAYDFSHFVIDSNGVFTGPFSQVWTKVDVWDTPGDDYVVEMYNGYNEGDDNYEYTLKQTYLSNGVVDGTSYYYSDAWGFQWDYKDKANQNEGNHATMSFGNDLNASVYYEGQQRAVLQFNRYNIVLEHTWDRFNDGSQLYPNNGLLINNGEVKIGQNGPAGEAYMKIDNSGYVSFKSFGPLSFKLGTVEALSLDPNFADFAGIIKAKYFIFKETGTPTNPTEAIVEGTMKYDNNFIYIRTATTWKKVALAAL